MSKEGIFGEQMTIEKAVDEISRIFTRLEMHQGVRVDTISWKPVFSTTKTMPGYHENHKRVELETSPNGRGTRP